MVFIYTSTIFIKHTTYNLISNYAKQKISKIFV